jgi:hypothetical protein
MSGKERRTGARQTHGYKPREHGRVSRRGKAQRYWLQAAGALASEALTIASLKEDATLPAHADPAIAVTRLSSSRSPSGVSVTPANPQDQGGRRRIMVR